MTEVSDTRNGIASVCFGQSMIKRLERYPQHLCRTALANHALGQSAVAKSLEPLRLLVFGGHTGGLGEGLLTPSTLDEFLE